MNGDKDRRGKKELFFHPKPDVPAFKTSTIKKLILRIKLQVGNDT